MNIFESTARNPYGKADAGSGAFMDLQHHFQRQLPEQVSHHRKVELQDPADLTYLIAKVSHAAREKIDQLFADGEPDVSAETATHDAAREHPEALRSRVEELVDQYISDTFANAKHNLSINGMDAAELEDELAKAREGEEIEPFDTALAQRVQKLASEIESRTLALANLRRTVPQDVSARFQTHFDRTRSEADTRAERDLDVKMQEARATTVDVGEIRRLSELERTWDQGQRSLQELRTGLAGTVARMEKAQSTVDALAETAPS